MFLIVLILSLRKGEMGLLVAIGRLASLTVWALALGQWNTDAMDNRPPLMGPLTGVPNIVCKI